MLESIIKEDKMLYEKIAFDMKAAMINKDKEALSTIRLLKSAIDLYKINNKLDLITDEVVMETAAKQVKTHKESIIEFEKAQRMDLVAKLKTEIELLQEYLPEQMSYEEVVSEVNKIIEELPEEDKNNLGKIMKEVSSRLKGKTDMKQVSEIVNKSINS